MKQADILLLDALKRAIHNEESGKMYTTLSSETRAELLRQAVRHGVLPLIFDVFGADMLGEGAKQIVFRQTAEQILKTQTFYSLYRKLSGEHLHPLVLKGPLCAALYPKPEERLFSDVDLLVPPQIFSRTCESLRRLGCRSVGESRNAEEQTFYLPGSPLVLELHGTAFPKNSAYGGMNALFVPESLSASVKNVQGEPLYTLGANESFLYLLCHNLKHFLHGGCGIRPVCDLLLFAEKHENELDVPYLCRSCEKLSARAFLTALLCIGEKYLGFRYSEKLKSLLVYPAPNEKELLEDILSGGVYGGAEKSRLHGANLTLRAASAHNAGKRARLSVLHAAFPSARALKCEPYKLPLAWGKRFWRYGRENLQNRESFYESIKVGKRRTALLKTYRIIR